MKAYGVTLKDWDYDEPFCGAKASRARARRMGTTIEESLEGDIEYYTDCEAGLCPFCNGDDV